MYLYFTKVSSLLVADQLYVIKGKKKKKGKPTKHNPAIFSLD